jgi:hypothetical protein
VTLFETIGISPKLSESHQKLFSSIENTRVLDLRKSSHKHKYSWDFEVEVPRIFVFVGASDLCTWWFDIKVLFRVTVKELFIKPPEGAQSYYGFSLV